MKTVEIFTDGACSGNPGPGGWGAILKYNGTVKEISGGEPDTTNNRMELKAVIEAVKMLKEPCNIIITTDSSYVSKAFIEGWIWNWIKNGWKKKDKSPVLNSDLWQELLVSLKNHHYCFEWIKGHDGHHDNERCDYLATTQSAKYNKKDEKK